jgi:hypothetical protein
MTGQSPEEVSSSGRPEGLIRHMRHPVKDGLLTIAGDEDCDIPELTAGFFFGGAQIEDPEIPHNH